MTEPQMVLPDEEKDTKITEQNLHQWSATALTQCSWANVILPEPQFCHQGSTSFPRAELRTCMPKTFTNDEAPVQITQGILKHINCAAETSLKILPQKNYH